MIDIIGAAALLLWGLRMVKTGIVGAFGARLQRWVGAGTRNRFLAFGIGLVATIALQSSSATALMTASFAGLGLVDAIIAQAIMLGANVGTSVVTRMLVIDVHFLAPLSIFVGVTAFAFSRSKSAKGLSGTFLGLGLMLLSLQLLGRATEPLQHSKVLLALMDSLEEVPFLATTIAAMLAMATSSSMATVLLAMSLAASGAVSPELGIALTLGANLGGAIPPVMATTQDEAAARRVTIGNLFVRLIGCIVALPFLQTEAKLLSEFSTDVSSIVVNAHIVFNILLAVVFLPALQPVSAILRRLVPEALKLDEGPRHLDPNNLQVPALALTGAIRETLRMGDRVASMIEVNMEALRRSDPLGCSSIASMDDEVDRLNTAIKFYLAKLDRSNLMGREIERSDEIMGYATNLEHIGDIVDRNLNDLVEKKIRNQLSFSTDGAREIDGLYRLTLDNLRLAQSLLLSGDSGVARQLVEAKVDVRRLEQQSRANHVARLHEGVSESIQTSSLHLDILRDLKRINAHIAAVAYPILSQAGALRDTRLIDSGHLAAQSS